MKVSLMKDGKHQPLDIPVKRLYCVGYAGRNQAKVREHIDELAKLGVPPPPYTPTVYPVSAYLLTDQPQITVQSQETSGEVEFAVFIQPGKIYISVGSDHTDRDLEKTDIKKSKQMCEKPVANRVLGFPRRTRPLGFSDPPSLVYRRERQKLVPGRASNGLTARFRLDRGSPTRNQFAA